MTNNLKCPFCGAELAEYVADVYECQNRYCRYRGRVFERNIWQVLIDGKKAQDALSRAISWLETIAIIEMGCATSNTAAKKALDEITSIIKQGNE